MKNMKRTIVRLKICVKLEVFEEDLWQLEYKWTGVQESEITEIISIFKLC